MFLVTYIYYVCLVMCAHDIRSCSSRWQRAPDSDDHMHDKGTPAYRRQGDRPLPVHQESRVSEEGHAHGFP